MRSFDGEFISLVETSEIKETPKRNIDEEVGLFLKYDRFTCLCNYGYCNIQFENRCYKLYNI